MASSSPPAWKRLLQETIAHNFAAHGPSANYYVLSTVDHGPPITPRARIVVHRGFLNEARSHNGDTTSVQPAFTSNTVLLTTTDLRSPKIQALTTQLDTHGQAYAEVCWWFNDPNLMFRLQCTVQFLPHASQPSSSLFHGAPLAPPPAAVPSPSNAAANSKDTAPPASFDWNTERARLFAKMPPGLVASFANPTGGVAHPNEEQLFEAQEPGPGVDTPDHLKKLVYPFPSTAKRPHEVSTPDEEKFTHQADLNFVLLALAPYEVTVLDVVQAKRSVWKLQNGRQGGTAETWIEHKQMP